MSLIVKKVAAFKVRPVNHGTAKRDKNRYCGPAVLSIMSGITTGDASRLIRSLFPQVHAVRGTSDYQIQMAYKELGIRMSRVSYGITDSKKPTLAGWLKGTVVERTAGRVFLVAAGNHWQIITGRRYICGIVKELVSVRDKRVKRRARVSGVYELTPIAEDGKIRVPVIEKPKCRKSHSAYSRVRKLIAQNADIGLGYDVERSWTHGDTQYWVHVCDNVEDFIYGAVKDDDSPAREDAFEVNDGRCCYSWDEVEDRMTEIVEFVDKYNLRKAAA